MLNMKNTYKEELFSLLKQFLENKKLKTADIPDDLPELYHLCEIHSLQPILCYMLPGETRLLRERYPDLEKKMHDQYIASAWYSVQQEASADEMAERFCGAGIPLAFFKGTLLRSFYSEPQLRTMSDIDCLVSGENYHIAKHLYSTGAGIRMFLDIAVFLQHYGNEFDWKQAADLLQKTRLSRTAGAVFQLCGRWFGTEISWREKVSEEVLDQLEEYITGGGTFGFETHDVGDMYLRRGYEKGEKEGKHRLRFRLLWHYLFPSADNMLQIMPAVEKWKWLLPAAWVKRWWLGAFRRRSHSLHTVQSMLKDDGGRSRREHRMLKELGL